jgi:hypothetical protein
MGDPVCQSLAADKAWRSWRALVAPIGSNAAGSQNQWHSTLCIRIVIVRGRMDPI